MKKSETLVVADLDGTLLDITQGMSIKAINRLNKLIDLGLKFTIATGRGMKSAQGVIKGLNLKYPAIFMDGGVLGDLHLNKVYRIFPIKPNVSASIISYLNSMDSGPMAFSAYNSSAEEQIYYRGYWEEVYVSKNNNHSDINGIGKDSANHADGADGILNGVVEHISPEILIPHISHDVLGMFFNSRQPMCGKIIDYISNSFPEDINIHKFINKDNSGNYLETWYEITSSSSGKEKMIPFLSDMIGCSLENIVYFGDSYNDIKVSKIVGKSIAVSNAVEELKEVASEIIGANYESAVLQYLEEHLSELL